ncbi:1-acyl-sn-glycerol-3-phosphate acyltransferase [Sorangium sp. So ce296]|uniref:1-acyl-sn-glycerol-3-phosphate acyltransferase n=1 Tax=Sorangium sp. So ce296 TaxID=3133296 RepID=UPI003F6215D4
MDQSVQQASGARRRGGAPAARSRRPEAEPFREPDLTTWNTFVFPALRALIKAGYFSLSVEGLEHVPRGGPVVYVSNHAGWFTIDTLFGGLTFADHVGIDRMPWAAVQDQLLALPMLGPFFGNAGGFPASWLRKPEVIPPEIQGIWIYPEGAEGNCKSFVHAYRMRQWRTGFLRLALSRGAKIVPAAIIGSEECLPSLAPVRFLKPLIGTMFALPLSPVPLPSRWKFIFHEPVDLGGTGLRFEDEDTPAQRKRLRDLAAGLRERVQRTLDRETSDRKLARFSKLVQQARSIG